MAAVNIDLLGHSTRDHRLLRLGGTVVDALDPLVRRFFEEVERSQVLRAMNAVSLRLLGCETGVSPSGLRTLRLLADILGLPVVGSRKSLSRTHYTATGFNPLFGPVLVVSAPIRVRLPTVPPGSSRAQTPTDSRSWILSTQTPQPLRFRGRSIATP